MSDQDSLAPQNKSDDSLISSLTERELEIIKLVISGQCNRDIADQLYISDHTVKTHRKNINKKLNVSNPVQLTLIAKQEGISPD